MEDMSGRPKHHQCRAVMRKALRAYAYHRADTRGRAFKFWARVWLLTLSEENRGTNRREIFRMTKDDLLVAMYG